jgi:aminoglycoside phosphotransferase (APT) family kinase protein
LAALQDPHKTASEQLAAVLRDRLADEYGTGTEIVDLERLSGGASRETWSFDAVKPGGARQPLILKRDPMDRQADKQFEGVPGGRLAVDRWTEGRLLQLAGEAGAPVPTVPFFLAKDRRTTAGFFSHRMEGEALGRRILREDAYAAARPKLAFQVGHAAARFHGIARDLLPPMRGLPAAGELQHYRTIMDSFHQPHAGFEYSFRWLQERLELAGDRYTLNHGDFRNGNILVNGDGLCGVLDWESAHLGNPNSDLGWMCVRSWRYGYHDKVVGGFGDVSELLDGYEAGGGGRVDPTEIYFWQVFGTLRWGILCMILGFTHIDGEQRSIEYAAIGRRAAETEYDLLQLLE